MTPRLRRWFKQHIAPVIVVILLVISFRSAIADWNIVPSGSMNPTIVEGDRIFVNKLAFGLRGGQRRVVLGEELLRVDAGAGPFLRRHERRGVLVGDGHAVGRQDRRCGLLLHVPSPPSGLGVVDGDKQRDRSCKTSASLERPRGPGTGCT
jgi:hypothetical protein